MDRVSFRIFSSELSGEDITELLDIEPATVMRKGDPVSRRSLSGVLHAETIWVWEPGLSTLEEQLAELSKLIDDRMKELSNDLKGCSFDILCSVGIEDSQRSLTLVAANLRPIIQIGADILLTILDNDEAKGH
jgi:Domain of unknown function (DUF4279)